MFVSFIEEIINGGFFLFNSDYLFGKVKVILNDDGAQYFFDYKKGIFRDHQIK